jgi:hypothetical protein
VRIFWTLAIAILLAVAPLPTVNVTAEPVCNPIHQSHYGATRQPADSAMAGIRAPIQTRYDGSVCNPGGSTPGGGDADWIGLQNGSVDNPGAKLVQAGLAHVYSPTAGADVYRGFWEVIDAGDGRSDLPHYFQTGDPVPQPDDYFEYFRVNLVDGGSGPNVYRISFCGTQNPTYSGCSTLDNNETAFSSSFSLAFGENQMGGCQNRMMGSTADPVNIGGSTYQIEHQGDFGATWGDVALTYWPRDIFACDYDHRQYGNSSHTIIEVWDERNAN